MKQSALVRLHAWMQERAQHYRFVSTTGLCEIKARAPFPHNAMLSTGRPHDGAKKKPPAKKHVSFCSTLHCGGTGRGLLFRTNR